MKSAKHGTDGASLVMLAQLAKEFNVPLRVLQTAARYGAIDAQKVSGFFWVGDRESVRRFVARKRRPSRARQVHAESR
jgi:hypothetical protein